MGLLDRLFGGNKDKNEGKRWDISPTAETMADEQFWNIIHTSYKRAGGGFEEQQEMLEEELRKVTPQDILLFDNKFRQLRGEAYDWDLWAAAYIIDGGCSDDSFSDFRDWVIAQGKDFYYKTITHPGTLAEVDRERMEGEWKGIGYVAATVFKEITGMEMPAGFKESLEIKGEEWEEEGDDLRNKFPVLWEKYS